MLFILKKLVTLQLVLLVVEGPEWLVAEKHERSKVGKNGLPGAFNGNFKQHKIQEL